MNAQKKKQVRRLILSFLALAAIGYGAVVWLSLQFDEDVNEYPWWEDYADYWLGDWINLIDQAYKNDNQSSKDLHCTNLAQTKKFGFITAKTQFCFDDLNSPNDRFIWRRHGLGGLLTNYKSWPKPTYHLKNNQDDAKQYSIEYWFPNGPFSLLTPSSPTSEKIIIEKKLTDKEIVDAFVELATELEYDPFGNRQKVSKVTKYATPIRLIVDDFSNDTLVNDKKPSDLVDELLLNIAEQTGLDIKRIDTQDGSENMLVVFLVEKSRQQFLAHVQTQQENQSSSNLIYTKNLAMLEKQLVRKDSRCFTTIYNHPRNFNITSSTVIIFLDDTNITLGCVHEEIIQSLGLTNDLRELEPSIFNDKSPYEAYTPLDSLFIQLLYDLRIKSGMTAHELTSISKEIVAEYRTQNKLEQLTKRVYQP